MGSDDRIARVREALAGAPVVTAGMTFVPEDALSGLKWGGRARPALLAAACSRLEPDFAFVTADRVWADEAVDRLLECGVAPLWAVSGPLGRLAAATSWQDVIKRSVRAPRELAQDMDAVMHGALEQVRRGVRLDVTAVVVADDVAGAAGPLVAPDFVLDEVLPRCAALAEEAVAHAVFAAFHSDGDLRPFLAAIARAGFAAVHPGGLTSPAFEELLMAARVAGLAVIGGISGDALREGGPRLVREATQAGIFARAGGLLVADDGGITTSAEVASLVEAIAAARGKGDS